MTEPTARRTPLGALLAWTLFIGLALYTVFLGGGWAGIYSTDLRSASLAIAAIGLGAWGVLAWRRPEWRPRSAIWPAIVAPLVGLAAATAFSPWPRIGIEYLAWSVLLAALYLLLVRILAQPFARARIGGLAGLICLSIGVLYVVLVVQAWIEWWGLVGYVTAPPLRPQFESLTFGNPSAVLTMTALLLPPAIAAWGLGTPGRVAATGGLTVLTGVVALLTGSRAGWVAIAGAIAIVGLAWLLAPGHRGRLAATLGDRRVRVGLVVAAVALGAVAIVLVPGILLRTGAAGENLRVQYLVSALRMFADAPLTGLGPGTWVARRIAYTNAGEPDYYIPHAHDVYAQTLAETGIVGVIAGIIALAALGWLVLGGLRDADPVRKRWGWAATLGLVYFALHNVLDFYANMPAALFAAAIPVAYLDATSDRSISIPRLTVTTSRLLPRAAVAVLALACVASVVVIARAEQVASVAKTATSEANETAWSVALTPADEAAALDPDMPPYLATAGIARTFDGRWTEAVDALAAEVAIDDLPQSWLAIAAARIESRDEAGARDALAAAMRVGVQQAAIAYGAGVLYERLGDLEAADEAYLGVLTSYPSIAADPSWGHLGGSDARFRALLERAMAESPAIAWELALMSGDPTRATELAVDAADPDLARLVIESWGGDGAATAAVEERANANPLSQSLLAWAARLTAHEGRGEDANRYRMISEVVAGLSSQAGYEVRVVVDPSDPRPSAGNSAAFYGHYTYRRPTPWDLLAAGIPRLVLEDEASPP